jgi:hypothetical protein
MVGHSKFRIHFKNICDSFMERLLTELAGATQVDQNETQEYCILDHCW